MTIHTLLKRGTNHKDFCEDFLTTFDIQNRFFVAAVFDGCSSGTDSHFASALFGKTMNCAGNLITLSDASTLETVMKDLLYILTKKVYEIKSQLGLTVEEILATINLLVIDKITFEAKSICIGDGFISVNSKHVNYEQDNRPDYLAYYLDKLIDKNYFEDWFNNFNQILPISKVEDVSITTDGIFSFFIDDFNKIADIDVVEYLLKDDFLINNKVMLNRKCNILKNKHGYDHFDDISIIRIINHSI